MKYAYFTGIVALGLFGIVGCGDDSSTSSSEDAGGKIELDAGSQGGSVDAAARDAGQVASVTYWDDMVPLFEEHCMHCHQEEGIGPFRLDTYASAEEWASTIAAVTGARIMPPWAATDDGSCGEFVGSLALTEPQIQLISDWVDQGAAEGERGDREIHLPALPRLEGATEYKTPEIVPEIQGGALAEFDEYRCYLVDPQIDGLKFITGYDVEPGAPELIHHVLGFIVDPAADSTMQGLSNGDVMQQLDDASPNREGWNCFGMAGTGVDVAGVPVSWAPGQGVVNYPAQSGMPLAPTDRLVIQVHYNLADEDVRGTSDQTTVRLRLEDDVDNIGITLLNDPLLGSLLAGGQPDVLAAGQESVKYTWTETLAEIGIDSIPEVSFYGTIPHMHERGRKFTMNVTTGDQTQCAMDVQNWDFHWQRVYYYSEPFALTPDSEIEVTCDYDTSEETAPILPGWGTRNEMCLVVMYVTAPKSLFFP